MAKNKLWVTWESYLFLKKRDMQKKNMEMHEIAEAFLKEAFEMNATNGYYPIEDDYFSWNCEQIRVLLRHAKLPYSMYAV